MTKNSASTRQTLTIGKKIATNLKSGDVVLLYGELGAGKTTLVKGIAKGLGVKEKITSPTFSLMNVYRTTDYRLQTTAVSNAKNGRSPSTVVRSLIHIDTYRLKNEKELIEIGAEDYIGKPDIITVIEWPEKIESLLKNKKTLKIKLEHFKGGRKIKYVIARSLKTTKQSLSF